MLDSEKFEKGELSEEEQVAFLQSQPEEGQTDNTAPADIPQPPQDADWDPNVDPNFDTVDPASLV